MPKFDDPIPILKLVHDCAWALSWYLKSSFWYIFHKKAAHLIWLVTSKGLLNDKACEHLGASKR